MFRQLASVHYNLFERSELLQMQPAELVALLEKVWDRRKKHTTDSGKAVEPGHPDRRSDVETIPPPDPCAPFPWYPKFPVAETRWDHLIYAYMVENTRIYEIFRRVVHEFVHGEKLGVPSSETQRWLWATEELFYRDPPPFLISSVASHIRPDLRANRRNAYQRMFGMDLNHGTEEGKPYPFLKAEAANSEFASTFEELLREVWVGMIYVSATSSPNPTDSAKIRTLAERLHDMLRTRRQNGNLSREEFAFVSMMSWFHMTVEFDSPVVKDLRAQGMGVEQRLFKIAERVGLPAHGLAKDFFEIADPISRILTQIEMGDYNVIEAVPALYTHSTSPGPEDAMRDIITHWAAITGHDVKAKKIATS